MLYELVKFLEELDIPGAGMMHYISFRSAAAAITSLLIGIIFGGRIIRMLARRQISEDIRDLGLEGQMQKKGTPTMGGLIILGSILIPILLFGDLSNTYILLMIVSTLWLGLLGFADDYIKVFRRHKEGLKGRFKIIGQVGLGVIVGTVIWLSGDIVVKEVPRSGDIRKDAQVVVVTDPGAIASSVEKTTKTTIPFFKNNELDYGIFTGQAGHNGPATWIVYILVAIFIITAVSNGANLTDGLDGFVTGVSIPIVAVLGIFAYLSGNVIWSQYLNIMYIPGSGELLVFAAALAGALIGFLWYNTYKAQVFMGDTGSLAIGGIIAVFSLLVRKELLLPLLCIVFLMESLSVMLQVGYFKLSRLIYGQPRRIFLMAPLHHHFQQKGFHENKIVIRMIIVQILFCALTLATLKVR